MLNQEAAVHQPFCFERSSFFFIGTVGDGLACNLHTAIPIADPATCPLEVKPHPMKTVYRSEVSFYLISLV